MNPTVEIQITRDRHTNGQDWEEVKTVSVEITYYKGNNTIDDPSELRADDTGFDEDGMDYQLTESEQREAESAFIAKINEPDCREIEPMEETK